MYITIDGGTTNTRISLVKNKHTLKTLKLSVGAKDGTECLKKAVRDGINDLLSETGFSKKDIKRILASGMITSEYGLYNAPHISAPAGIKELHESMCETELKDITDIPFVFIRGVKVEGGSLEETDMMRGEETELIGIMKQTDGKCIYILPGSHSKLIETDEQGRIVKFSTMLTGEMTAALSQNTILKDAVDLSAEEKDREYLLKGYDYCAGKGINEALFKVRILKNIFGCTKEQLYSFFMGIILCGEIQKILASDADKIIIGGKKQIKEAMCEILTEKSDKCILSLSDEEVSESTSSGMIKIFEYK